MSYVVVYRTKRKLNAKEKSITVEAKNQSIARTNAIKRIGYVNTIISIKELENV